MQFTTEKDDTVYAMSRHHDSEKNLIFGSRAEEKSTAMLFRIAHCTSSRVAFAMGWAKTCNALCGKASRWTYDAKQDPRIGLGELDEEHKVLVWDLHTSTVVQTRALKDLCSSYITHAFLLNEHGGIPNWDRARMVPEKNAMLCVIQEGCPYEGECSFAHGLGTLRLRFCGFESNRRFPEGCPLKRGTVLCKGHVVPQCLHFHEAHELQAPRASNYTYVRKIHEGSSPLANLNMPLPTIKGMSGTLVKYVVQGDKSHGLEQYEQMNKLICGVISMPAYLARSLGVDESGVISGSLRIKPTTVLAMSGGATDKDREVSMMAEMSGNVSCGDEITRVADQDQELLTLAEIFRNVSCDDEITHVVGHKLVRRLLVELQKLQPSNAWTNLSGERLFDSYTIGFKTHDIKLVQEVQKMFVEKLGSHMYYVQGQFESYTSTQSYKAKQRNKTSRAYLQPGELFGENHPVKCFARMRTNDKEELQYADNKYGERRPVQPDTTITENAGYYGARGGRWLAKINSANIGYQMTGMVVNRNPSMARRKPTGARDGQQATTSCAASRRRRRRGRRSSRR